MPWYVRIVLGLAVCSAGLPDVLGQEPAKAKAKVELRWVEVKRVDGVTEERGFQSSCDPDSIVYPHKKPALVLSAANVADARLTQHDFSASGLNVLYMVALHLTKDARDTLAKECKDGEMRLLTVVVDGKCWGLRRYEKGGGELVPVQARAETFTPDVGFFSSQAEAQRLVDAVK